MRHLLPVDEGVEAVVRHSGAAAAVLLRKAQAGQVLPEASAWMSPCRGDARAEAVATLRAVPVTLFRDRVVRGPALAEA